MRRLRHDHSTGLLGRLRKNVAGNVLILAAAAMIPLCAMVGGALDLSRLYLTKVRLQHACDAGALAGRKQMGGGSWNTAAQTAATNYFNGNFRQGAYGSAVTTAVFTSGGSDVTGTVTSMVPMTLMAMFNVPAKQLTVNCMTAMQLPNTDVMFVLDTTGSMAELPNGNNVNGGAGSKIAVLRNSVKCFYEALAQQKTNATNCAANSYAGINSDSQLRFGFVPYASNVNISQLGLPASYFATNWSYQSRSRTNVWSPWTDTSTNCYSKPADTTTRQYRTTGSNWNCVVQMRTNPSWLYAKTNFAIDPTGALTAFRNTQIPRTPPAASVTVPGIGDNFANRIVDWDGCIEEQPGTANINLKPNAAFAPMLPDALYLRNVLPDGSGDVSRNDSITPVTTNYYNAVASSKYTCPAPAEKLTGTDVWTPTNFANYVDALTPSGNTYHDYGMLWGGRLLSPEGMFASENGATGTGGVIQRHLIFMTDGDARANACDYTNYGVAWWDLRTNASVGSCNNALDTNLTNDVNTRLAALCTSVKNEPNTLIWVISFGGTGITTTTKNRLRTCASDDDHFFDATDATKLKDAFEDIAARIAQLRLKQ
jgi:Flp pilus assembly protein TadG